MKRLQILVAVLALGALAAAAPPLRPTVVRVAAASDLRFAAEPLLVAFRAEQPEVDVNFVFGSSGNFFSQISNGAPFDLFLSADAEFPRKLAAAGKGVADNVFVYASGRLALVVPAGSAIDPAKEGLRTLVDPSIRHVAIANPKHAPYGRIAEAALAKGELLDPLRPKLVLGENVAQAAQFVETGAAEAGIVALSIARAPAMKGKIRSWEIPEAMHPKLEQAGLVLAPAGSAERKAIDAFRAFLLGGKGRAILAEYGFSLP